MKNLYQILSKLYPKMYMGLKFDQTLPELALFTANKLFTFSNGISANFMPNVGVALAMQKQATFALGKIEESVNQTLAPLMRFGEKTKVVQITFDNNPVTIFIDNSNGIIRVIYENARRVE